MKRVASLGIVVLLCGVGLQGGVTLPVQQESSSHFLYEPKSPLARNHKLLQLVTEADRALQLSSGAWGSMLIHDEWSELTGWLAMARGRKPKDFKQRCVALRNFIQQSPEVDPVVSAAVLKALACIMRTYTGMSVGAKVGIGVGVTATALAAAVAVLAMFAKLCGRMQNPRSPVLGDSPQGSRGASTVDPAAAAYAAEESELLQNTRAAGQLLIVKGKLVKKLRNTQDAPPESVDELLQAFYDKEQLYDSVGGLARTREIFQNTDSTTLVTAIENMYSDIERAVHLAGAGQGAAEGSVG